MTKEETIQNRINKLSSLIEKEQEDLFDKGLIGSTEISRNSYEELKILKILLENY